MNEPTFLRLDAAVKDRLRVTAKAERRSMASLIEELLRAGLATRPATGRPVQQPEHASVADIDAWLKAAAGQNK